VEAERRQLTVMFCDLVGSTALSARLDPEDLRDVIGAYHGAVAEVIGRFDGFVAKYMGDGVLGYFGYPQAHEDDAERAVRAGLAVVAATRRLQTSELLQVRIGLATGLTVVGNLIGSHPQVVARAYLGFILLCLGFPDQASTQTGAAIAEARTLAHPPSLASSLMVDAMLLSLVGDGRALSERAKELVAVAVEQGVPWWHTVGTVYQGWVEVKNGNVAEGKSFMRSGLTADRATSAQMWVRAPRQSMRDRRPNRGKLGPVGRCLAAVAKNRGALVRSRAAQTQRPAVAAQRPV
jgi:hypothetical protein